MADDFIGMPLGDWLDMDRRTRLHGMLLTLCLTLLTLLVMTLIQRGVLAGWGDLIHDVTPA